MPVIANPYAKTTAATAATAAVAREKENVPQVNNMGPQSQRRLTLQERTHQLQSQSHRKKQKVTGQQTLFGDRAFDPLVDCEVCRAKQYGRAVHRAHHKLCNNKRGGCSTTATKALAQEEKRLKLHFAAPLTEAEKCSAQYTTREAVEAFFVPRDLPIGKTKMTLTSTTTTTAMTLEATSVMSDGITAAGLCAAVTDILKNPRYAEFHKGSNAPAPMLAFAKVVVESIILNKQVDIASHFDGLTMTVPANQQQTEPHYHSIVGQKLLYVDWKRMYGLDITCPRCQQCPLKNDRTNFSKNKILFPVFVMEGPPLWCMTMSMVCPCCRSRINSNSGEILSKLPAYARVAYPVDSKYALENKNCHIGKSATNMMDLIMPTYGNGDLCSRLLYNAINRSYIDRVEDYYSSYRSKEEVKKEPDVYIEKDGCYITAYPPLGDGIRDTYDTACSNSFTSWGISDHDRHTREIQAVRCGLIFAQDHTHEVTKNYFQKKTIGATALWDVSTETGEIASAVLVPTTKTIHFSHAAAALTRRECFSPAAMYSDTWPVKSDFWNQLFNSKLEGRLGLFHYIQRITKTLKKKHTDHFIAVNGLLNCIYHYNVDDYEMLLKALKEGTLSTKYSDEDVRALRATKAFRQRYDRYLRKEIRPPNIMASMLDDWFDRFKCSASECSRPARGRRDPRTGETLFTGDTKEAIRLAKVNAKYLQDPLPIEKMYLVIQPNPNAPHQLKEYMSRRGESSLESFHSMLAHFGNCGMRTTLIDNLNLTGTARHNLSIRHKLRLTSLTQGSRKRIPAAFESVVAFFNHSELAHINTVATSAGLAPHKVPFKHVEILPTDNGERFFSEYIAWMNETKPLYDAASSRCLCKLCNTMRVPVEQREQQQPQPQPTNEAPPTLVRPNQIHDNVPTATERATIDSTTAEVHQPDTMVHPKAQVTTQQTQTRPQQQPQPMHHQQQGMMFQPVLHQHGAMMMGMGCYSPMPQLFTQYQPWPAATYTAITPTATFCCGRYRHWHNRPGRRGRPPHDDHCHHHQQHQLMRRRNANQSGNNEKNRSDNLGGVAI